MHVKERPKGSGRYFLADNPKAEFEHALNCPRYHVDDGAEVPHMAPVYETGVDHEIKGGEEYVHVNIRVFATQPDKELGSKAMDAPLVNNLNQIESSEHRFGKAKVPVAFGGLIREWYMLGLEYSRRTMNESPNCDQLLRGMWKVMINRRITVDDGSLDKIAIIPFSKVKWRPEGQPRIILGYASSDAVSHEKGLSKLSIRGIDTEFNVLVRNRHLPRYGLKGRLCALRVVCQNGEYITINHVFGVLIHPGGAVWLDSSYEWKAYDYLLEQGYSVEKPLLPSPEWYDFKPDFVLRNTRPPVVIEVWGMPDTFLHYHHQKERKKEAYQFAAQRGNLVFVEWDVNENDGFSKFVAQLESVKK